MKKLKEIFEIDDVLSGYDTIFHYLRDATTYPLVEGIFTLANTQTIADDYFVGHSAEKYVSPLLEHLFNKFADDLTSLNRRLANDIYLRFGEKWKRIYDALLTTYNPLENYSMIEERTPELRSEETENINTEVTTNRETNASSKYKGFNASEPVTITTTDGTEDVTTSGASGDNETHRVVENTGTETLTRSGNIGVTTSQQMLESEFKVRQYDFYKMIYNDIDSILCLSIY